jgi:hypothetical protein
MRVVLWGIIALVGLGLLLESIGVHGSKDERAAIRRAVRAPLADLQRRDARSLCDDFTPAVDADFADGHGSDCESNVDYAFQMTKNEAAYAPPPELPSRLQVTEISWHGSHGAAVSVYPGKPDSMRQWKLAMLDHRWRIETPAKLELQADCQHHLLGTRACVRVMLMRFAANQGSSAW